ncbi:hypothetical protein NQZ79_g5187 [Umbelopsis isabellina]|nr:hypothetical protein NQZ79_g5187 [Umbelopsis isabellina]
MRQIISIFASAAAVLLSVTVTDAKSLTGDRVLVLLDNVESASSYNKFWSTLQDRDYDLTFSTPQNQTDALLVMGRRHYDHIVHFAPETKVPKESHFSNQAMVKFVEMGGNILVGLTTSTGEQMRDFVREFDVELDSRSHRVFDDEHFISKLDNGAHDTISTKSIVSPKAIVDEIDTPIVFRGIGHRVGKIPLLSRVLVAEDGAYTGEVGDSKQEDRVVELVSAMQARNNARVTIAGSLDMFSDSFLESPVKSGNEEFVKELSRWTFQEKSVLKVHDHRHHKDGETHVPEFYRIKDNITYTVEISEYNGDSWAPYHASDIQLEIIMLDPHIRTTLQESHVAPEHHFGRYKVHTTLPDVYGVFTFKVNYKRPGLTYLTVEDVVAIRPFRHDEYPRFLSAAYPYYTAVGSMIVGFLVFSGAWLATWGSRDEIKLKDTVTSQK